MSKCRIVNRRLNGQFLASGAVDDQILDRIEHGRLLRDLQQERKQRQQALRDARRPGANLTFTIFDKLNAKGDK